MEEATLDFANAAPGNMGRQRVTDQVRIRIVLSLQHQLQTKRNIWNLDASTGVQNSRLQYSGGRRKYLGSNLKLGNNLEFYLFVGFSPFFNKGMW